MKPVASGQAAHKMPDKASCASSNALGFVPGWPAVHGHLRHWLQALVMACVYAGLSTPAAFTSSEHTLAAIIWPAPALAAAMLWRMPVRRWPAFLLAVFLAMMVVGNLDTLPAGVDVAFALLNVLEVALLSAVGRRFVSERGKIDTARKLARFIFFLPVLVTACTATLGATIGMLTKQTAWLQEWHVLMMGNGLAVLVLLPAALAWRAPESCASTDGALADSAQTPLMAALLATLLLLLTTLFDVFAAELLRTLLSLVLVWAAIQGGIRAVACGIVAAATTGIGLTLMDIGPYASLERNNGVWQLQMDLAGLAVLSFFVAITFHERQKLNLRLDRAKRFESIGLLAGGIAHDFNNILGSVGGYAEMANEQLRVGDAAQKSLHEVTRAVSRGKALTDQILQAGKQGQRAHQVTDFRDVVLQSTVLARPLLPAGIHMTVNVPTEPVPTVLDPAQLVRALLNLMNNAFQAAMAEVTVTLYMSRTSGAVFAGADHLMGEAPEDRCAWVDVTDDGAGIAPDHIHQLFEPFFSSRAVGSRQGTGLGLAIVAGVATDHAGGVAVWSGHGAATRFRLMLPLAQEGKACGESLPFMPAQGQAVLVLQPDTALRERCEEALAALGFEPLGYAHHAEMLATLRQSPATYFLLLLADVTPDGQQEAILKEIYRLAPHLAVIVCLPDADTSGITQTAHCVTMPMPASFDDAVLRKAVTMAARAAGQLGTNS